MHADVIFNKKGTEDFCGGQNVFALLPTAFGQILATHCAAANVAPRTNRKPRDPVS